LAQISRLNVFKNKPRGPIIFPQEDLGLDPAKKTCTSQLDSLLLSQWSQQLLTKFRKIVSISHSSRIATFEAVSSGPPVTDPSNLPTTLPEILRQTATKVQGDRLTYLDRNGNALSQSYHQLRLQAERVLGGLREIDLNPQERVILLLEHHPDLLSAFWGCILGGFVPVIVEANSALEKIVHLKEHIEPALIVVSENTPNLVSTITERFSVVPKFAFFENLARSAADPLYHIAQPDDLAFLTLSSGSTGKPKCIKLSHRNLIIRARGVNFLNKHKSEDLLLNWLPFEHIGSISDWHIRCVLLGSTAIYVEKEYILGNILNWLELIDRYRVTHSWSPSFAYALMNDRLNQNLQTRWDLSCLTSLLSAGEMVSYKVMQSCLDKLATYRLKKNAIQTAFGMAEFGSGITYSSLGDTSLKVHFIDVKRQEKIDPARVPASEPVSERGLPFVELGVPISGVTLRIVDESNRVLPEGKIGNLQVKGEAVFSGYYNDSEATKTAFIEDGWFQTGDLGFLSNGRLVLTGRSSGTIIINGVNYYSHEIESVVEKVEGVNVSYTAACGIVRETEGTEKLAIFFNCDLPLDISILQLLKTIRNRVINDCGVNLDYLIPLPKDAIDKTSIGKIQRSYLTQRFLAGEFDPILKKIETLFRSQDSLDDGDLKNKLTEIWQEVLRQDKLGLEDNFFELGGSSLSLMQVQQKIGERLGYNLGITALFRYPTINSLVNYLMPKGYLMPKEGLPAMPREIPIKRRKIEHQAVAIIGMAGRFPGAKNITEFWQNLTLGKEAIAFFSDAELLASGVAPNLLKNPNYVKASPILDDIEKFDADFFGYTAKEAELLEPQQRLLLECAWESLEDAGYDPLTYNGAIALYGGAAMNTYLLNNIYPNREKLEPKESLNPITLDSFGGFQMMVANDKDYLTSRVSYKLNLKGPSINVQTACSTSLAAVRLAIQGLLDGSCDLAMAGGVSVRVPQKIGHLYQEGMILSPDGRCRAFDAEAKGTIFGSGVGLVVLKPLEMALQDRDRIYAVIKGSAISNDGGSKVNYLAPNGEGQTRAAAEAIAQAEIDASSIGYVETHGTGTLLGDPIEIDGLTQAFRFSTEKKQFCAIGSVKTNVGHLQIASGIAGLIKTVLALHYKKIPPSLHFKEPNPQINFTDSPFYVNTKLLDWEGKEFPRRAGVNSLGIGGTNVHLILEEANLANKEESTAKQPPLEILTLSAKNETALQQLVREYDRFLENHPTVNLGDVCFTSHCGRSHHPYRWTALGETIPEIRQQLRSLAPNPPTNKDQTLKIAFLFPGEATPLLKVGRELYETQPIFQETIDWCGEILQNYLDCSLLEILYGDSRLRERTRYSQGALFALEYALFSLWKSWGIEANAAVGVGLGEYVAACVAGVFGLEDGLKLVAAKDFKAVLAEIAFNTPQTNLISSMRGTWNDGSMATAQYWRDRPSQPVRFEEGIQTLSRDNYNCFIECGPNAALLKIGKEILLENKELLWLPSLDENQSDWRGILASLAKLYQNGARVNWQGFEGGYSRHRISLPTYPFQRQRYWWEGTTKPAVNLSLASNPIHPLLGNRFPSAAKTIIFQADLSLQSREWLKEHRVNNRPILSGSTYLEIALAAAKERLKEGEISLENISLEKSLVLPENSSVTIQTLLEADGSYQIYSLDGENWNLHSQGEVKANQLTDLKESITLDKLQEKLGEKVKIDWFYQSCQNRGLNYGQTFQLMRELYVGDGEAFGKVVLPSSLESSFYFDPRLLDGCFQVTLAAFPESAIAETYVPVAVERFVLNAPVPSRLWSHAKLRFTNSPERQIADLNLFNETGSLVAKIEGLTSQKISSKSEARNSNSEVVNWFYQVEWRRQDKSKKVRDADFLPGAGSWLILADKEGVADGLTALLKQENQNCLLVFPSATTLEEFQQLIDDLDNPLLPLKGVINLWGLNEITALDIGIKQICQSTLYLTQILIDKYRKSSDGPQLWLITRGSQSVGVDLPDLNQVWQSPLWGLGKTIALESPELNCVCLDLDATPSQEEIQLLWQEIQQPDRENQIALRQGYRYVARLVNTAINSLPRRLTTGTQGTIDRLAWQPASRRQPQAGEVEIKVKAAGLNFRDVLNALNTGNTEELGLECAGEVVAVGEGANHFQVGDRVFGLAKGSFADYVTVSADWVVLKPDYLSFEEAATISGAFLTAYYSLIHRAELKAGEKVLIHAAAGGVGLAAVQLAQNIGAEVLATASQGKWQFLRDLGIKYIMNSRTLDFAKEIKEITQEKGVDVVLNSLSGDFIAKSLSVLHDSGRFAEIGKKGIWTEERVRELKPKIDYFTMDLLSIAENNPQLIQSMLQVILSQLNRGLLEPLPYKTFSRQQVREAFRTLQQAKHIGKVVIGEFEKLDENKSIKNDASYLIAGGFGDLGLSLAQWLASKGARSLILVGRNEPSTKAIKVIQDLEAQNVKILPLKVDVTEEKAVETFFATYRQHQFPPLKGVILMAGIIEDGVLSEMSWEQFERVIAPKVKGAWNLHRFSQSENLDFFVLFSSAASLLGSPGQGNYSAANAFIDSFASARRWLKLPGLSINWGAFGEIGMAARQHKPSSIPGMKEIKPERGWAILEQLLSSSVSQVGVAAIDWADSNAWNYPFFEEVTKEVRDHRERATGLDMREQLESLPVSDRQNYLTSYLLSEIAKILGVSDPEAIALDVGFSELGLDSLGVIELRNRLQTTLSCSLPSSLTFDYSTINLLISYLMQKLFPRDDAPSLPSPDPDAAAIEQLSEAEAEALLLEELAKVINN